MPFEGTLKGALAELDKLQGDQVNTTAVVEMRPPKDGKPGLYVLSTVWTGGPTGLGVEPIFIKPWSLTKNIRLEGDPRIRALFEGRTLGLGSPQASWAVTDGGMTQVGPAYR